MKSKVLIPSMLIFFIACADNGKTFAEEAPEAGYLRFLSTVDLPQELSFCGEKLPLETEEVRERAEREFYLLLQQPGQLILYIKRAGRYFPMYERILEETGMPDDLKYLSVAESALFMARSAKDAVGLWQIIEPTAESLGLRVDEFVDERRHPEKSTRAGLKYLKEGFDEQGSWILAAAGYNMGHSNLARSKAKQKGDDYFDLYLNEETSRYIFRIAIIKEIMQDPERYGLHIDREELYKPAETKKIRVNGEIPDLYVWCALQGTSYKEMKLLNPWILKDTLNKPRNGFYEIEIPE